MQIPVCGCCECLNSLSEFFLGFRFVEGSPLWTGAETRKGSEPDLPILRDLSTADISAVVNVEARCFYKKQDVFGPRRGVPKPCRLKAQHLGHSHGKGKSHIFDLVLKTVSILQLNTV